MLYNYREGKTRVTEILDGDMEVIEADTLPAGGDFTFDNAYRSWLSAVFIDLRKSTELMASPDQEYVAKVVRSFTSEIIEILRNSEMKRDIGIRGDCVYAVYTTPSKEAINEVFNLCVWCNCYLDMLNTLLKERGYEGVRAGIGFAIGHDHVIKAGRKNVGINDHVWMGDAVSTAAKLSGYGDKDGIRRIVLSGWAFCNVKDFYDDEGKAWFVKSDRLPGESRHCSIVFSEMEKWISTGMPD